MGGMNANEIQRQARNAVRKGSIAEVGDGVCRVAIGVEDDDPDEGLVTNWIPWFAWAAGDVIEWRQPSIGEQVMLLCPMGDPAQGVALCGIYSDRFLAPANAANVTVRRYPDGSLVVYDHEAHAMAVTLTNGGTVRVIAPASTYVETQNATVKASEKILLDGDVEVTKTLLVRGLLTFESGMTGRGTGDGATMQIDGPADFTGVVTSAGVSLPGHTHREQGDGNLVGSPINIEGTAP